MEIFSFCYNSISDGMSRRLNDLISSVWGNVEGKPLHLRELNAMSFCAADGAKVVGYAGDLAWPVSVEGRMFRMGALSCVCTHPSYRKKGIGSWVVRSATKWMMDCSRFDVGLFTCASENVSFYEKVGLWEERPCLILKESEREGAFVSDKLGLHVFRLLISDKARANESCFDNAVITLDLPEGLFI